jgi:hypothetical protein
MKTLLRPVQVLLIALLVFPLHAQKRGLESINQNDLKAHMKFLASDELEGRDTGEPGLYVAARYLASQAEKEGLKPVNGEDGYFQHYIIHERTYDRDKCRVAISTQGNGPVVNRDPVYTYPSLRSDSFIIEGEVVFAGYGINDEESGYNDFRDLDVSGKVVLIMSRAPMNEDGTKMLIGGSKYSGMRSSRNKMPFITSLNPKAVLVVNDPKSAMGSTDDLNSGMARYLRRSRSLDEPSAVPGGEVDGPRRLMIPGSMADQILQASGRSLKELQMEIDRDVAPHSFQLEGTSVRVELFMKHTQIEVPNVFGIIEGSDPKLKDEMILYLAHFDHMGTDSRGGVFNGADDNASGTAGLLEIAQAFMNEKKPPSRSIGFLWVSAEEIGLFGSQYFASHPLVPIQEIVGVINLDMIGRTKTEEDIQSSRSGLSISGGDTVKVIGGMQSSLVMDINKKALQESGMVGNYEFNDLNNPERYFFRSDHINFARKDIPVLFYSTGTHNDYHTVNDTEEKIDYTKFVRMVDLAYRVGYTLAGCKGQIVVDNPMSGWEDQGLSR